MIEPEYKKQRCGLPVLHSSVSLIPTEHPPELATESPLDSSMSSDNKISTFLVKMKPEFKLAQLIFGCSNYFCDGIHVYDDASCPTMMGHGATGAHLFKAKFQIGTSDLLGITSRSLAEYFVDKSMLQVCLILIEYNNFPVYLL